MSKRRDEYLQKFWNSYPEMPKGALKWGRVQQMRLGMQNLSDWSFKDTHNFKACDVLIDADLVALMPQQQLILLAPNLTLRPVQSELWPEHKKWQDFLSQIRQFFKEKKFSDVKTPTLVLCPGTEPSIEVFETEFQLESKKQKYFLPTSPELNLKKLLAEGAEKIFELAPVFRNGEKTNHHSPEFIMLEWYRAFSGLSAIKLDVIELVEAMADYLKVSRPAEVLTYTVQELFKKYCDFDLTPETTEAQLKTLAQILNIDVTAATCIDDYFYLIFIDKIENKWPKDRLVFVEKYPPYQAALARIGIDGWAERFEVYWQGEELGNAFHELNDPELQRQRALEDINKKKAMGKKNIELDVVFFASLKFGMPPSAGIAVGAERLYMALNQINDISFFKRMY